MVGEGAHVEVLSDGILFVLGFWMALWVIADNFELMSC